MHVTRLSPHLNSHIVLPLEQDHGCLRVFPEVNRSHFTVIAKPPGTPDFPQGCIMTVFVPEVGQQKASEQAFPGPKQSRLRLY